MHALEKSARIAVIAGAGGCLLAAALHGIPLLLPIVIGSAIGLLVRWLPAAVRSLGAFVRRDLGDRYATIGCSSGAVGSLLGALHHGDSLLAAIVLGALSGTLIGATYGLLHTHFTRESSER